MPAALNHVRYSTVWGLICAPGDLRADNKLCQRGVNRNPANLTPRNRTLFLPFSPRHIVGFCVKARGGRRVLHGLHIVFFFFLFFVFFFCCSHTFSTPAVIVSRLCWKRRPRAISAPLGLQTRAERRI
jgi:hypothetical protein